MMKALTNEERTKMLSCEDGVISRKHNADFYNALESFCYPNYGVHFEGGCYDSANDTYHLSFSGIPGTGYDILAKKVREHFGIVNMYADGIRVR